MNRLHPQIFTEIALSLVPLANAPTWVKALWVEKELEERGLWQDDVFDLVEDNVRRHVEGRALRNLVDMEALGFPDG